MTNGSLMKVKSIAECSPWNILQYFWHALSDNWGLDTQFVVFLRVAVFAGFAVSNVIVSRENNIITVS